MLGRQNLIKLRGFGLLIFLIGISCNQSRSLRFAQGDGENIFVIADFKDRTQDRIISKSRKHRGVTSRADKLLVHDNFNNLKSFDEVDFEINSPLTEGISFEDLKFYGMSQEQLTALSLKTNKTQEYEIHYKFTDSHVIFLKVAREKMIPSQERTYAETRGDGRLAVPIFGLPIELYSVEKVEDNRGKDTRTIRTFPKDYLHEASHFKVRKTGITFFNAPTKFDLLTADYFDSDTEWYYTKTIVGRPVAGAFSGQRLGDQVTNVRMKFVKTKNSILGIDVNIAPEQEALDPQKLVVALEIPVKWVDYRTKNSGPDAFLTEEEINDDSPDARVWNERSYLLADFNNADRLQRTPTQENKLESLEIGQDYIGFLIYESSTGLTWKFSMVKAPEKVAGTLYPLNDRTFFHYFFEVKEFINGNMFTQQQDIDRQIFLNRYYPRDNKIVFNITKDTPHDAFVVNAIKKAVSAWDKAFQEADTGIRILLDDKRVDTGDVRYNKISFYGYEIDATTPDGFTLLGFGPNIGDSRTGEVFTSTTNMYLRSYREGLIESIRKYVRSELGLYEKATIEGIAGTEVSIANTLALGGVSSGGGSGVGSSLASFGSSAQSSLGKLKDLVSSAKHAGVELFVNIPPLEHLPMSLQFSDGQLVIENNGLSMADVATMNASLDANVNLAMQSLYKPMDNKGSVNNGVESQILADFRANKIKNPGLFSSEEFKELLQQSSSLNPLDSQHKMHEEVAKRLGKKPTSLKNSYQCDYAAASLEGIPFSKIKRECVGKVPAFRNYISGLLDANKGQDERNVIYAIDGEEVAVLACANALMEDHMTSTLMHEMGHNFGLGHNFMGSADKKNFPKDKQGNYKFLSSSVMDYPNEHFDRFQDSVGPYDVAALRYAYGRKVETTNTQGQVTGILSLKGSKSIAEAAKKQGVPLQRVKQYKVCDDNQAGDFDFQGTYDPMCRRWDTGSDPVEVVDWVISDILATYMTRGFSHNSLSNIRVGASLASQWLILKQIYEKFRTDVIVQNRLGTYLDNFSGAANEEQQFRAALEQLMNEQEEAGNDSLRLYFLASEKIFQFASDILFYPSKICVLEVDLAGNGPSFYLPINFTKLREGVFHQTGENVFNCGQALPYLNAIKDRGQILQTGLAIDKVEAVHDIGMYHNDLPAHLTTEDVANGAVSGANSLYAAGTLQIKDNARFVLFNRGQYLIGNIQASEDTRVSPSFMDDPRHRRVLLTKIQRGILSGSDVTETAFKKLPKSELPILQGGQLLVSPGENIPANAIMVAQYLELENDLFTSAILFRNLADRPGQSTIRNSASSFVEDHGGDTINYSFNRIWPAANDRADEGMIYNFDNQNLFRRSTVRSIVAPFLQRYNAETFTNAFFGSAAVPCSVFSVINDTNILKQGLRDLLVGFMSSGLYHPNIPLDEALVAELQITAEELQAINAVPEAQRNVCPILANMSVLPALDEIISSNGQIGRRELARNLHAVMARLSGQSIWLQGQDLNALNNLLLALLQNGAELPQEQKRVLLAGAVGRFLGDNENGFISIYQNNTLLLSGQLGTMGANQENFRAYMRLIASIAGISGS